MTDAFIVSAVRTPIGRAGGALAGVRPDDLAALALRAAVERGRASRRAHRRRDPRLRQPGGRGQPQRGADGAPAGRPSRSRCRARPSTASAAQGSRRSRAPRRPSGPGEGDLFVAGGVESMTRAPYVMLKSGDAVGPRHAAGGGLHRRLALRQPAMPADWTISLGETAERVAAKLRHHARRSRTPSRSRASGAPRRPWPPGHFDDGTRCRCRWRGKQPAVSRATSIRGRT